MLMTTLNIYVGHWILDACVRMLVFRVGTYVYLDYRVPIDMCVVDTLLCTSPCSHDMVTVRSGTYLNGVQLQTLDWVISQCAKTCHGSMGIEDSAMLIGQLSPFLDSLPWVRGHCDVVPVSS